MAWTSALTGCKTLKTMKVVRFQKMMAIRGLSRIRSSSFARRISNRLKVLVFITFSCKQFHANRQEFKHNVFMYVEGPVNCVYVFPLRGGLFLLADRPGARIIVG